MRRGAPRELRDPLHFEVCEGCGRTLLPGEQTVRLAREEQAVDVCPLCAARLLHVGYWRAA